MGSVHRHHENTSLTEETGNQKAYTIGGVPVIFPYKAYPTQIAMMDKIVTCLNNEQNCLLESPTGSGKSLALLCATIAWLKKYEKKMGKMKSNNQNASNIVAINSANGIVENNNRYQSDFENHKFYNYHNYEANNTNAAILIQTANSSNVTKVKTTFELSPNESIHNLPVSKRTLNPLGKNLEKSPCMNDHLKRQSTVHDVEELENFQPMKKKLFPDARTTRQSEATSSHFCKFTTSDVVTPLIKDTETDSPQKRPNSSHSRFLPSTSISKSESQNILSPELCVSSKCCKFDTSDTVTPQKQDNGMDIPQTWLDFSSHSYSTYSSSSEDTPKSEAKDISPPEFYISFRVCGKFIISKKIALNTVTSQQEMDSPQNWPEFCSHSSSSSENTPKSEARNISPPQSHKFVIYKKPASNTVTPQNQSMNSPPEWSEMSNNSYSRYVSNSKNNLKSQAQNNSTPKLPKIYFGTRTHKQIAQIIRELKKTPYKDVKMTILSSRERTCIHGKVRNSHNKNEACDELLSREEGPGCGFFIELQKNSLEHYEIPVPFDLEDFVSTCRRKRICPYFGARELLQDAEIVFCPYNYLVDPLIKSAMDIELDGNIVIMDEAHNIEDSAREAASSYITLSQLDEITADVFRIVYSLDKKRLDSEPYMYIGKVLRNLKMWMKNCQDFNDYVSFNCSSKVWSGKDMLAILNDIGLGPDTYSDFLNKYKTIVEDEKDDNKEEWLKLPGGAHACLKGLIQVLYYMYKDNFTYIPDYRFVIAKTNRESSSSSTTSSFSQTYKKTDFEITVNFWCLNPSVAFSEMMKNTHSVILASGTLAPLTSFQSELGIPFQVTYEARHVVSSEHLWVGTIGKGPTNNTLWATFENASTFVFQDDIGKLVLEVCTIIRHGILCFLPSYGMLDRLVNRWRTTGLWDKLLCKKVVLCEPRQGSDLQDIIQKFYDAVKNSENNSSGDINGALFLAVCRGKVSEGLDFADNNARAVITVGIPFPNIKDAQVDLKKKYNDIYSSKKQIVTGGSWYEMQAFRAINQALGRCIRHRDDFGALIIVDERFQMYDHYTDALSSWIKKEIKHYFTYHEALSSLSDFADQMGLKNTSNKN